MSRSSSEQTDTAPTDARSALDDLRARRDDGETLPAPVRPLDLSGARIGRGDLARLDLSGIDLSGAELVDCNFQGSRLVGANLEGALFRGADLTEAELLGSQLTGADFTNAVLDRAGLGQVDAADSVYFGARCVGATFSGANLSRSDFRTANLESCRMLATNLTGAVLSGTSLRDVELTGAVVDGATLRGADLRSSQLRDIGGFKAADWIGTDIRDVDFTGAWNLRRHIQDENYIDEFRSQSKLHGALYHLWSITSDCGRSLLRWSLLTALVAVVYAGLYTLVDIDWGDHETTLSPLYYSVVTFTTLGYGDVLPASTGGQLMAMSEVILGYFSLGGMMSILSDKMARRAG